MSEGKNVRDDVRDLLSVDCLFLEPRLRRGLEAATSKISNCFQLWVPQNIVLGPNPSPYWADRFNFSKITEYVERHFFQIPKVLQDFFPGQNYDYAGIMAKNQQVQSRYKMEVPEQVFFSAIARTRQEGASQIFFRFSPENSGDLAEFIRQNHPKIKLYQPPAPIQSSPANTNVVSPLSG